MRERSVPPSSSCFCHRAGKAQWLVAAEAARRPALASTACPWSARSAEGYSEAAPLPGVTLPDSLTLRRLTSFQVSYLLCITIANYCYVMVIVIS